MQRLNQPEYPHINEVGKLSTIRSAGQEELYAYGPEGLHAQRSISGTTDILSYALLDVQGSLKHLTDATGALTLTRVYDAWGVVRSTSGSGTSRLGYTGELQDGNLVYLRARWYHTGLGTFTSRDTYAGTPERPQSLHRYGYAENRPTMLVDPSGYHGIDPNGHWTGCNMLPGREDSCSAQDYVDWWGSDDGDKFRRFGWTVGTELVHGVVFGLPEGLYYLVTDPAGAIVAAIRAPVDTAGQVIHGTLCGDPEELGRGTAGAIFMYMGAKKGFMEWADTQDPRPLRGLDEKVDKPLHMDADPLRKYGSAQLTHPQEFAQAMEELRAAGVDIDFRPGSMAYSPQRGGPGRLIFDPDASIGALRHEL